MYLKADLPMGRSSYRFAGGVLVIAASLILAGCSSGSAGVHLQTADPPSGTPAQPSLAAVLPTTIPSQRAVSSAPTSTAGTEPASRTSSTTGATTQVKATTSTAMNPWPADFTPTQQAAAEASLAAVKGYIRVEAQANAKPSATNWTEEVRRYTADPAAYQALKGISSLAAAKVHATVPPTYEALTVKSADVHRVVIRACVDSSKSTLVDASGQSVLQPPKYPRTIETFTVSLYAPKNGGWLVSETGSPRPQQTC